MPRRETIDTMILCRGSACVLLLLWRPVAASGQGIPNEPVFDMQPLAPGVYAAVVLAAPPVYAFANSLVVVGDEGVLVVDTQASSAAARALIARIRGLTDAPVRWVVNTHWHGDHVYGNAAYRFAFPSVEIIGHTSIVSDFERTAAGLAGERTDLPRIVAQREASLESGIGPDGSPLTPDQESRLRRSIELNRGQIEELRSMELVGPTRTVDREIELTVGERRVRILHFGSAHTDGDLVVHLPEDGIAAVGDLVEEGFPYAADGDPAGWAVALDSVRALNSRMIVPGHGSVQSDGSLLDLQSRLFTEASVAADGGVCGDARPASPRSSEFDGVRQAFERQLGVPAAQFDAAFAVIVDRAREGAALDCATPQRPGSSR